MTTRIPPRTAPTRSRLVWPRLISVAAGVGAVATGKVAVTPAGAVIRVVRVAVDGAVRGDVNAVVTVVAAVVVRIDVRVAGRDEVRLAGIDAVIGVATGESGDA